MLLKISSSQQLPDYDFMDLTEAFDLLNQEMGAHGLIDLGWTAKLDDARKRFGVCRMGPKEISLSRPLIALNPEEEVRDTILHEIAHALSWETHKEPCGHDERWKTICVRIGARPDRCYDDEVIQPELPWALCHVETGEIFATYQRKPSRDPSQMWMRGRKEETFGKMEYRLNPKMYPPGALEKFDRNVVREMQAEVMEAMQAIGKKWGVQAEQTSGKFNDWNYEIGLRFAPGGVDGRNPEEREFGELAGLFGLSADDYQRAFLSHGKPYRLIAFKPRNRKYPVIGMSPEGKRYKFPRDVLENLA